MDLDRAGICGVKSCHFNSQIPQPCQDDNRCGTKDDKRRGYWAFPVACPGSPYLQSPKSELPLLRTPKRQTQCHEYGHHIDIKAGPQTSGKWPVSCPRLCRGLTEATKARGSRARPCSRCPACCPHLARYRAVERLRGPRFKP